MKAPKELPNPVQKGTMMAAVAAASAMVVELNGTTPAAHASGSTTTPATVDRAGWGRGAVAGRARLEEIRQIGALYAPSPMDESQPAAGAEASERRRSNTCDTGSATATAPPPASACRRPWWRMLRRSVTGHSPKEHPRPRAGVFISGSLSTVARGSSRVSWTPTPPPPVALPRTRGSPPEHKNPVLLERGGASAVDLCSCIWVNVEALLVSQEGASTTSNRLDHIIPTGKSPRHKMSEEERRSLGVTRRATELALIKKGDRLIINPHVGEFWFVIDAKWINSWVKFVMGQASAPGAISNLNLYPQDCDGDQSTSAKCEDYYTVIQSNRGKNQSQ
ncbi:unnamed protein product [Ectocarpus sp. CCAP 1310/34]|nr:unnamed protein product [Ectocarpus sp. CCAP 1310/34]